MKPVIIYYSYEGSCAFVAESLKDAFNAVSPGAELFSIKTADNTKRGGLVKYLWGGSQVLFGKNPELLPLGADINACDLVVLGTPVWAASPAPALVSFLEGADIRGKKIALFCCHSGGKGKTSQ